MTSLKLLRLSDKLNIPVYNFKMSRKKAFCVVDAIAVDFLRVETERECKALLSEELGHVITGALYPLSHCINPLYKENIDKQERKAYNYSLTLQVPLNELKDAISHEDSDYEIAESLDVDIQTLQKAVEYYRVKGML